MDLFFFSFSQLGFSIWIDPSKQQILYLIQAGDTEKGIALYQKLKKKHQEHDFSILEQIGSNLLAQGAKDSDETCHLLTMYGASQVKSFENIEIYRVGMRSKNPLIQLATIQFLREIEDDRAEELLLKGLNSHYLPVCMEAAYALALRQSLSGVGPIESLMQRLPSPLHVYFPHLFVMMGSPEALFVLKKLMGSPILNVRLSALLAAAKFGRDDCLNGVRAGITHSNEAESETCAAALGYLQDSHSISLLKKLTRSRSICVKLAACRSLIELGHQEYQKEIIACAQKENLFAISLLADIPNSEPLLVKLIQSDRFSTCLNAALALLKKRDARALPILLKMLIQDHRDMGFEELFSPGYSLTAWKVIFSCKQYAEKTQRNTPSISLALREQILKESLELPEDSFLKIAKAIFDQEQSSLLPLVVRLLENIKAQKGIELLQRESRKMGNPLVRAYSHLSLYRQGFEKAHRPFLIDWIKEKKDHEMIRFLPLLSWKEVHEQNQFQLTPEDTSRLLVEIFIAFADRHDLEGLDTLLHAIQKGNPKNRYVLAGLLLKSIQ